MGFNSAFGGLKPHSIQCIDCLADTLLGVLYEYKRNLYMATTFIYDLISVAKLFVGLHEILYTSSSQTVVQRAFRENRCSETHTLFMGVNENLSAFSKFFALF